MRRIEVVGVFVVALIGLGGGCVSNRDARDKAQYNRSNIKRMRVGQSEGVVRLIMRHGPESTSIFALPDGSIEHTWNYLTNYAARANTTLRFVNGKLVEVSTTRWLGDGDFSQPLQPQPTGAHWKLRESGQLP